MSKETKIRKIHVQSLLATLADLWDKGVDFVDVHTVKGDEQDEQDELKLSFMKEYMNNEYKDNFEKLMSTDDFKIDTGKFNDEDLNDLI